MKINVGSADRWARILLGLVILGAGWALHSFWGLVGLVPLVTGTVRSCPVYSILGVGTNGPKDPKKV